MKITFTVINKSNPQYIKIAADNFITRINRYFQTDFIEINVKYKSKDALQMKKEEAVHLIKAMQKADLNILLDENGKTFTSVKFADFLQQKMNQSVKHIQFIVGGAYGFSDDVYKQANMKMSLSDMTFSHQLIRVIFLEQLYRGISIIKGLPYHNE